MHFLLEAVEMIHSSFFQGYFLVKRWVVGYNKMSKYDMTEGDPSAVLRTTGLPPVFR